MVLDALVLDCRPELLEGALRVTREAREERPVVLGAVSDIV